MKNLIFILLLSILLTSTASALIIEERVINDATITEFSQPAKFELTIREAEPGTYNLYTLTDVRLLPASSVYLNAGTNKLTIYVYATEFTPRGSYTFTYFLKKIDGESFEDRLSIKVVDLKDAIDINSDSNDPDSGKIGFYIINLVQSELTDVKANFSSVFFDNFEYVFDLKPYEKKEFTIQIDKEKIKTIAAGSYILSAEFDTNKGKQRVDGKIYLGEKKVVKSESDSSGILIRTNTVSKINAGNVLETVNIKIKRNIFTRIFTSFNNEPNLVDREGFVITYSWTKQLGPAEILTIKAKTNYIFPLLIIVFCVLIILGIKRYLATAIEIKKSAHHVRTKGKEFALKVRIRIKAKKDLENVSLIDRIPAIVKVYEKFGLIKPTVIDARNRRLQWDIGDLMNGEERVFNYLIYSKVGIVGKFSLPEAIAVFEKNNEIHEVKSNKVFFMSEQIKGN